MKIEISSSEYRDLLDILHIADVILSGHRREPDIRSERHRALIQKLYALAPGEGLGHLFGKSGPENVHAPTPEFEESTVAHTWIDEFGDHLFWDELISRLSTRDAAQTVGGMEHLNAMSDSDRRTVEGPIRQSYIEEFSRNSINNLAVIEQFTGEEKPVVTSD